MSYQIKITIDNTKVGGLGDHTDFPVLITEESMPVSFWANAAKSNIWLQDSEGAKLKREIVSLDNAGRTLELWVKVPTLSYNSDTILYLNYGDSSLAETNDADTWDSDFEAVLHLKDARDGIDSTGVNNFTASGNVGDFAEDSNSGEIGAHQGVAFDGTNYYVLHTDNVKKYDIFWNLLLTNNTVFAEAQAILAAAGGDTYNHMVDGAVFDGFLYFGMGDDGETPWTSLRIVKMRTSDLVVTDCVENDREGVDAEFTDGNLYVDETYIYAVCYNAGGSNTIFRFNLSDYSHATDITLSASISYMQGISWNGTHYFITGDANKIFQVQADGTILGSVYQFTRDDIEGIQCLPDGKIAVLYDDTQISDNKVYILKQPAGKVGNGCEFDGTGDYFVKASFPALLEACTLEISAKIDTIDVDRRFTSMIGQLDWKPYFSGGQYRIYCWRGTWVFSDVISDPRGSMHRFAITYNGSNITFYLDGIAIGSPAETGSIASEDFYIGSFLGSQYYADGVLDEFRVSSVVRSPAWLTTCFNNQDSPSTFYSAEESQIPANSIRPPAAFAEAWR